MSVFNYSANANANTSISGIDIGEACLARNINDAIRQQMADIAAMVRDWVSPRFFGAAGDGSTNDNAAMALAVTHCTSNNLGLDLEGLTYVLNASSGSSPINFAVPGLAIRNGGLKFTGTGMAFVMDGGDSDDGGVASICLQDLVIEGGSSPTDAITDGFYSRVIVRSVFRNIEVRNVGGKAFHIKHGVSNQYDTLKYSTNDVAQSETPTHGIYVDDNGTGHYTADCTFINPIMEGFAGIGCELVQANGCQFLGGTFEGISGTGSNGKGLVIGAECRRNHFSVLWCEVNTTDDIEVNGHSNIFTGIYCGSASASRNIQLLGDGNVFFGGSLRSVDQQSAPVHNRFYGCGLSDHPSLGFQGTGTLTRVGCVKIDTDQNVSGVFDDIIGPVQSVAFAATQVPSSDANTLDDYEEGEVTVTLAPQTSGTITLDGDYDTLRYTKIGRQVTYTGLLFVSGVSSPLGALRCTGLAHAPANLPNNRSGAAIRCDALSGDAVLDGSIEGGQSYISLQVAGTGASAAGLIQASSEIYISITFFTT